MSWVRGPWQGRGGVGGGVTARGEFPRGTPPLKGSGGKGQNTSGGGGDSLGGGRL